MYDKRITKQKHIKRMDKLSHSFTNGRSQSQHIGRVLSIRYTNMNKSLNVEQRWMCARIE